MKALRGLGGSRLRQKISRRKLELGMQHWIMLKMLATVWHEFFKVFNLFLGSYLQFDFFSPFFIFLFSPLSWFFIICLLKKKGTFYYIRETFLKNSIPLCSRNYFVNLQVRNHLSNFKRQPVAMYWGNKLYKVCAFVKSLL